MKILNVLKRKHKFRNQKLKIVQRNYDLIAWGAHTNFGI